MPNRTTSVLTEGLFANELLAWDALTRGDGAEYYRENLTEHAVLILPIGVLTRDEAIDAMRDATPWSDYVLDSEQVVQLSETSSVLTYRARAFRSGQPCYTARMTTIFVFRRGKWMTAFHQQTPTTY